GPFAGGRRVQVRPRRDRARLHARPARLRALRRHDAARFGGGRRLLPDEGHRRTGPGAVPGQPGAGAPGTRTGAAARGGAPMRPAQRSAPAPRRWLRWGLLAAAAAVLTAAVVVGTLPSGRGPDPGPFTAPAPASCLAEPGAEQQDV